MVDPGPTATRVAVHSQRRLFREALAAYLSAQSDYEVVGHTGRLDELIMLCDLCDPDVVLVDIGAVTTSDDELVHTKLTWARTVIVYDEAAPPDVDALWRLGVKSIMPCSHGLAALLIVLRRGASGGGEVHQRTGSGLTDREQEIIALIGSGHTVDRVAALLGVTPAAVSSAKRRIYQKMHVESQSQAVALASTLGILAGRVSAATPRTLPELTGREVDILRSIAQGHTVRQTARMLGIAHKTVENTQARLFGKLGVRNRSAALSAAQSLGLLDQMPAGPPGPDDKNPLGPATGEHLDR